MSKEYLDKCEEMLEEINKNTNNEIYKLNVQIFEKNNELIRKNEEIERLNHYEQENKELTERIEFYQRKTQRLEKRNKEIYEGFKATIQESCDTTKELEDYKSRYEKAKKQIVRIIDYGFDYDGFNDVKNLKKLIDGLVKYAEDAINILNGDDK